MSRFRGDSSGSRLDRHSVCSWPNGAIRIRSLSTGSDHRANPLSPDSAHRTLEVQEGILSSLGHFADVNESVGRQTHSGPKARPHRSLGQNEAASQELSDELRPLAESQTHPPAWPEMDEKRVGGFCRVTLGFSQPQMVPPRSWGAASLCPRLR